VAAASGPRVAVVGGGWSGLAAALKLADAGCAVSLFEAAPQLGGRARRVELQLGDRRFPLDNGQHLLIGAYRDTLALMRRVGVDSQAAFLRLPFTLRYPDGFALQAARLPAPLHLAGALLFARGLRWTERLALARAVDRWRRAGWAVARDHAAIELMDGVPGVVVERIWQPLCVAALNVRLEQASAALFLAVLRDSLGADRAASDLLLPRADLSALLPDAAERTLAARGVDIRLRSAIDQLAPCPQGWTIASREQAADFDAIVLAVPPWRAVPPLECAGEAVPAPALESLRQITPAPITTVYLRYEAPVRLPLPAMALLESPAHGEFGQWVFDRGALDARCAGVLSVVISAAGSHEALDHSALARAVATQLTRALSLPAPIAMRVIEEKRATIVPRPNLQRPPAALAEGLFLAADATASEYPSTIEGSVRSGYAAARTLLEKYGHQALD
jgi:squalene-associated FAD-dependent desaturase